MARRAAKAAATSETAKGDPPSPAPSRTALPETPSLDAQDASILRTFIEAMIEAGAVGALVAWLLAYISRLWKRDNDLLERVRSRARRNGENEKLSRLQLSLPGLDWSAANDDGPPKAPRDPKKDKRKRGNNKGRKDHGRAPLPPELERKEEKLRVPDALRSCRRCGHEMTLKEWILREILERIPARFWVRSVLRERLQCPCCQRECVAAEPADTIKDNGVLGVDLVVDAMVDHLQDAVPFERMERNARAEGVPLAANTLASSVHALIDRCQPIVEHIFQRCVSSQVVGADATTMPVLDPKVPRGIRHMALWNLLGDNRFSYFSAAQSGHGDKLKELLKGCTLGVLQCDGSATLNKIEAVSEERAGCHSHARCKFVEALKSGDARAIPALLKYTELFAVEAESKALRESHDERLLRRITQSRKLITELWDWVDELRPNVEPRSKLGQALTYMVNQRATLEIFLSDGRVAMTNNAVERELRTYVLDRKTWMFCGNKENAERTAAGLTIVRTCRLLGVDPRAYLKVVVRRLLAGEKDPAKLWPENFAAEYAATKATTAAA
jgi:transposase